MPPLGVHGRPDGVGVLAAEVNDLLVAPVDFRLRHGRLQQIEQPLEQFGLPTDPLAAGKTLAGHVPFATEHLPGREFGRIELLAVNRILERVGRFRQEFLEGRRFDLS